MRVFTKGLNMCAMRKQKLGQYGRFIEANGHTIVTDADSADKIVLWTCGFREDACENSLAEMRRYSAVYPGKLLVAGCLPDILPEAMEGMEVRVAPWKRDKEVLEELFGDTVPLERMSTVFGEENVCDDATAFRSAHPEKDVTFHDQFVKLMISEGCNYECAYCSERLAFPPYRSFPERGLVAVCRRLVEDTGCYDVMLLSDSLGDYGCEIGTSLPGLMTQLLSIDRRLRLALNNMNPAGFIRFKSEIFGLMEEDRIRHLNLPIQSASAKVLNLMKRPYALSEIEGIFGAINDMGFTEFDTHIIVGFPGETEEDFTRTMDFLLRHRPKYVLASGYMESANMASAALPNKVDQGTKRRRLKEFGDCMRSAGIICNTDDSILSTERLRRLNRT